MVNLRKFAHLNRLGAGLAALATGSAASPAWADVAEQAPATTTQATSEFIVIPVAFGLFMVAVFVLSKMIRGGDGVEREGGFPIPFDDDHPHHH
jgi:hypothetical protein